MGKCTNCNTPAPVTPVTMPAKIQDGEENVTVTLANGRVISLPKNVS